MPLCDAVTRSMRFGAKLLGSNGLVGLFLTMPPVPKQDGTVEPFDWLRVRLSILPLRCGLIVSCTARR